MKKKGSFIFLLSALFHYIVFSSMPIQASSGGADLKEHQSAEVVEAGKKKALNSLANMPLSFIENRGQFDSRARFYSKTPSQTLWFTEEGIVFDLLRIKASGEDRIKGGKVKKDITTERLVFTQRLVGATPAPRIEAKDPQPGAYNHFIGNNPEKWQKDMKAYKEILYHEVYPGIDMKLFGKGRDLEQEFHIRPGADAGVIRISYEGIEGLRVSDDGSLIINTGFGELKESRPTIYQEIEGKRVDVAGRFKVLEGTTYTIELGPYNQQYALIIDPTLVYSTYLGGSGNDYSLDAAVDSAGNAYLIGWTESANFPMQNPYQGVYAGNRDVYVAKFNAAGSALVFSTYLGGSNDEYGRKIALDNSGNVYITGGTWSPNFPMLNPYQGTNAGESDAFVSKLSTSGSLLYSTYLGGSVFDWGLGIAVYPSVPDMVYVTGMNRSSNFPTTLGAYDTSCGSDGTCNGALMEGFVSKLDTSQVGASSLIYSTFLGGSVDDFGRNLVADAGGNVYVAGASNSTDFPTVNPLQGSNSGNYDLIVTIVNPTGSALLYSTYIGGSGFDRSKGIALDSAGNIYVTGDTQSLNFPVQNAYQVSYGGGGDGFVIKLNAAGSVILYSTYLGGTGDDSGWGIAADDIGNVYITGWTWSTNFPTVNPIQAANAGSADAIVSKIDTTQSGAGSMVYSTYLGGIGSDWGYGMALDSAGNVYFLGETQSTSFPTKNPFQASHAGGTTDVFVTKISDSIPIHLVFNDNSYGNNEIVLKTSIDGGITWSTKRLTNNTGSSSNPSIAVSGNNLYIAWQDDSYGNNEIVLKVSPDNGATWTTQRLSNNSGSSTNPSIAVNGNNLYVAWQDDSYGNSEIVLKSSTDNGATWALQRLTNNTGSSSNPSIAVNGNNLYVVWQDDSYGNNEIAMKRSADGGATWSTQRFTNTTGQSYNPSITVDGSNIYVVWHDDTYGNNEILFKMSTNGGATWSLLRLTNNTGSSSNPSIAVNGNNLYIVWQDDSYGNNEIVLKSSSDNGATWALQRLTNNTGSSSNPSVAVRGAKLDIVWNDNTAGNNEIYLKTSSDNGATWSLKRMTTNTGESLMPVIIR